MTTGRHADGKCCRSNCKKQRPSSLRRPLLWTNRWPPRRPWTHPRRQIVNSWPPCWRRRKAWTRQVRRHRRRKGRTRRIFGGNWRMFRYHSLLFFDFQARAGYPVRFWHNSSRKASVMLQNYPRITGINTLVVSTSWYVWQMGMSEYRTQVCVWSQQSSMYETYVCVYVHMCVRLPLECGALGMQPEFKSR